MLEYIKEIDHSLLVFLNNLGSETFDPFWLMITKQLHWTPLFAFIFYLTYKKIGLKNLGILVLFLALLILFVDQMTNLSKWYFERLRPCNNPEINDKIRVVISRTSYSFFSGHASNSMATTVLMYLLLRKYYKYSFLYFLFPLVFAYSRIYLGLHFPSDIIVGYFFGAAFGFGFYKLYAFLVKKYECQSDTTY